MPNIDTRKIAVNTILLYIRMGLVLLIGLYTARVILDSLGEIDFGLYNSIGGIVAMFSFACGTLSAACQRFFMVEMGKGDDTQLRRVFSLCLMIFVLLVLGIALVTEPLGLWFMEHKMQLAGRTAAARWVFHCSILSFAAIGISLPFQGLVIAREKMNAFAYISVFEAVGALAIALLIRHASSDRLIFYAILMLVKQIIVSALYIFYCLRHFPESHYIRAWDKGRFKEIFAYTGWNLIGTSAGIFKVYGVDLLLNMFYGPAVNAARGMAFKVYGMVSQLRENFMTASKPQIIKSYSGGEYEGMKKLVFQTAKFSNYLMLFIAIPLMLEMSFLLGIWLKEVPQYTGLFAILMLVNALLEGADYPVMLAIQANGNIRNYQIVVGCVQLLLLPICYLLLKFGTFPPQIVFYVAIAISICAFFARMYYARKLVGITIPELAAKALLPMLLVALVPLCAAWFVRSRMPEGWLRLICVTLTSVVTQAGAIWFLGLTASEKDTILREARQKLQVFHPKKD